MPGRTLSQKFCRSRPLDQRQCELGNPANCKICPLISNGYCSMRQVVYRVDCLRCSDNTQSYVGETDRPCHHRFSDRIRADKKPLSYSENAVGKHYQYLHRGLEPVLKFSILDQQTVSVGRKISEAMQLFTDKPTINDRAELSDIMKFVVK